MARTIQRRGRAATETARLVWLGAIFWLERFHGDRNRVLTGMARTAPARPAVPVRRKLWPVHDAQPATWLKLLGLQPGLRINFNVVPIKSGVRWRVNRG
jgi:hypothetical protein